MLELDMAEVELMKVLRAFSGELRADRLGVLKALYRMTAETALMPDRLLADEDELGLRVHAGQRRLGLLRPHFLLELDQNELVHGLWVRLRRRTSLEFRVFHSDEEGRDVGGLLVGEAQIRHAGLRGIMFGVFEPGIEPFGLHLAAQADKRRAEI